MATSTPSDENVPSTKSNSLQTSKSAASIEEVNLAILGNISSTRGRAIEMLFSTAAKRSASPFAAA